jgi:hypothetical protein
VYAVSGSSPKAGASFLNVESFVTDVGWAGRWLVVAVGAAGAGAVLSSPSYLV